MIRKSWKGERYLRIAQFDVVKEIQFFSFFTYYFFDLGIVLTLVLPRTGTKRWAPAQRSTFFCTYAFCYLTLHDLVIFPSSSRSASNIQWFDRSWSLDWTHNYSLNENFTLSGDVNWYCDGNSCYQVVLTRDNTHSQYETVIADSSNLWSTLVHVQMFSWR